MITWEIYLENYRWRYKIKYNESSVISLMSGGFGPCFEKSFIEYRRVKYLQDKLLDVVIHLEELEKRYCIQAARELLGI